MSTSYKLPLKVAYHFGLVAKHSNCLQCLKKEKKCAGSSVCLDGHFELTYTPVLTDERLTHTCTQYSRLKAGHSSVADTIRLRVTAVFTVAKCLVERTRSTRLRTCDTLPVTLLSRVQNRVHPKDFVPRVKAVKCG